MHDAQTKLKQCRERLASSLFRVTPTDLSKELALSVNPRDGSLSSHMLRVNADLTPTLEEAVQLACGNLGFPRDILDVYVMPKNESNAYSSMDGSRAQVTFNSYLVEVSDLEELAYVVGHELGHYIFQAANMWHLTPNLEGCMFSRYNEFTMDRIGLIACRNVNKAVSANLKIMSGLSNRHLRMDATAIVAQWREASKAADTTSMWLMATHPPTGLRAKALIQFFGSDAYRYATGQTGGEPIDQVNAALGSEIDRLLDNHAKKLIAEKLDKLSGWLCAFVACRGIKLRLSNLRHGLCSAPEEIIRRCLGVIIEETPEASRPTVSHDKLLSALQEACELAPGHTRVYLQSVAGTSHEIRPLLKQLDEISRQHGIMIIPPKG